MNTDFIPLASPDIRDEDIARVNRVLRSGMLVQGSEVQELESSIANYVGTKHGIATNSGTSTLHLILVALNIKEGDEVILPAFSYMATANVVELVGAKPVFVDISLTSFNIKTDEIERHITAKTKAIIVVHEFGLPADLIEINRIAVSRGLFLIEDAACALGASELSSKAGSVGIAGSFSFHPRKAITSGEGGIITTNNDELAQKLRALRNHGIEIIKDKMEFIYAGFNYRMTDFQASLLNSQFARFEMIMLRKKEIASIYLENIENSGIFLPEVPDSKEPSWQTFHVVLDSNLWNRDKVIHQLKQQGVGTNYGAQCMPEQMFFKKKYGLDSSKIYPNALSAYQNGLAIPLYEKLTDYQVQKIVEEINKLN